MVRPSAFRRVSSAGTEVVKEALDILLTNDNLSLIANSIMCDCCVNDAIRKFLQFQISTNITTVIITFFSTVASDEARTSVLTAVQLLWINIMMNTFATLTLTTNPTSESLLNRIPNTRGTQLFTADMIKTILGQSIYQVAIILVFHFPGRSSSVWTTQRRVIRSLSPSCSTPSSLVNASTWSIVGGSTTGSTYLRVFSTIGISSSSHLLVCSPSPSHSKKF